MTKKCDKVVFARNIGLLLIIIGMTFIWYRNNHWKILMGDDLIAVTGFKEFGFIGNLFNSADFSLGKVRPIQKIILYIAYIICDVNYKKYYIASRLLVGVGTYIIYKIARKSGIDSIKSGCIAILVVTCPFSAYAAWQYIGITETFSLVCCVLYAYLSSLYLYESDEKKCEIEIWGNTVCLALLIFNAERFMYMVVIHILVIFIKRESVWKKKIKRIIVSILPIIVRSLVLKCLGSATLGTGRDSIWVLLSNFIPYTIKAFVNMLGFSLGDSWHGGFAITQISPVILLISCIRVFIFIGALYTVIKRILLQKDTAMIEILVWYLFSLSSLFSYALVAETHGEDRFLWVPYVLYLFALSRYIEIRKGEDNLFVFIKQRYIGWAKKSVIIISCFLLLLSNFYYYMVKGGVHFRYSQEIAQTAYDSIKKLGEIDDLENVAFVNSNDYAWVFYGNSFVHYYLSEKINSYYYNSVNELNLDRDLLGEKTIVIYPDLEHKVPFGAKAYWLSDFNEE